MSLWSNLSKHIPLINLQEIVFYSLILFLPTQLGKHFWPSWSLVYGQRIDYLSPTLYLTDIFIIALFIIAFAKRQVRIHPFFLLLIAFLSFSIFLSKSPMPGWYLLLKMCEMTFVAWYISSLTKQVMAKLGLVIGIGIIFESLLALLQFFLHSSVGGLFYFFGERTFTSDTPGIANASIHGALVLRPYATFSHPNVLAGFLLIGLLLVWYLTETEKNFSKIFLTTVTLIGLGGLLLTLSRSAILLGLFVVVFLLTKRINKKRAIQIGFVIIALFLSSPLFFYRFSFSTFDEPFSVRVQLLEAALRMISTHPLLGVGLGNFISSLPSSSLLQPVHNVIFLWVSETGLVGALFLVVFLTLLIKKIKKTWQGLSSTQRWKFIFLPVSLFCLFALGMVDHYFLTLQQGQLLAAVVIGLIWKKTNFKNL